MFLRLRAIGSELVSKAHVCLSTWLVGILQPIGLQSTILLSSCWALNGIGTPYLAPHARSYTSSQHTDLKLRPTYSSVSSIYSFPLKCRLGDESEAVVVAKTRCLYLSQHAEIGGGPLTPLDISGMSLTITGRLYPAVPAHIQPAPVPTSSLPIPPLPSVASASTNTNISAPPPLIAILRPLQLLLLQMVSPVPSVPCQNSSDRSPMVFSPRKRSHAYRGS